MDEIKYHPCDKGAFVVEKDGTRIAELVIGIRGTMLTAYHTEVEPSFRRQGLGQKLVEALVAHARSQGLLVTPLCPYVKAVFQKNRQQFGDVWHREQPSTE